MSKAELMRRYLFLLAGLFVNSLGIVLVTRANLGTSPISSVPYVFTMKFPLSLGAFTMLYSLLLIVPQLVLLGRRFPRQFWLEVPVSLLLSVFIDLSMALLGFVDPQSYPTKVLALLIGCLVLGFGVWFGVFMEMAANVVMLPGECTVKSVTIRWGTDFGKTKVAVDVTMAASAAVLGLLLFGALTGVREGTFVSALLVGMIARFFAAKIGGPVQTLLESRRAVIHSGLS